MARRGPKQKFSTVEVLERARDLFWARGYRGTSIQDLETATGISRISLYNKFGSKEGVYLAVIENYFARVVPLLEAHFAGRDLSTIPELFALMTDPQNSAPECRLGCLLVNTITDKEVATPAILEQVRVYRALLGKYFEETLRANESRLARPELIPNYAMLLTTLLWGTFTNNRLDGGSLNSRLSLLAVKQIVGTF